MCEIGRLFITALPPLHSLHETLWLVHQKELLDSITNDFAFLNDEGQEEAAKRIQELTEIPKYRRRIEDELQDKPTGEE